MINISKINSRKILLVSRYFWPDRSSCSEILFYLAKNFNRKKYYVDVISGRPHRFKINYSKKNLINLDKEHNVNIKRINLFKETKSAIPRIINAFLLSIYGVLKLLKNNHQIVIVTSCPPIITSYLLCLTCKILKKKFIYYCMDINPEIGIITGDLNNKIINGIMFTLDKWTCKNSSKVIVHSNSMKISLLDRGNLKRKNIEIINSFTVPKKNLIVNSNTTRKKNNQNDISIIYAGNIGRFQGLDKVIRNFAQIKDYKDIKLTILGEGEEKEKLIMLSKKLKANIVFRDHVSYEESKEIIKKADLGLISLIPFVHKYAYPSKLMSYLEQGIPILGIIEEDSDLARDILRNKAGYVVSIQDQNGLAELLLSLRKDDSWKAKLKRNCIKAFNKEFSHKVIIPKWNNII